MPAPVLEPTNEPGTLPFHIRKRFKFYEVSWFIENFYLQTCEENWEICSPEFDGPRGSRLKLILKCRDNLNSTVSFVVRRSDSDSGPETLWVNSRVHVSEPSVAAKHLESDKSCCLRRGSESETGLAGIFCVSNGDKIMLIKADSFCVVSKIIIHSEEEDLGLDECSDAGLRSLSEDMFLLLESSREVDVKLRIGNNSLLAHKPILRARCEWFGHLIDSKLRSKYPEMRLQTLDLSNSISDSHFEGLRKILAFIYTGNLIHVLEEPSLAIYDLAVLLDVVEIKIFYIPETLHFVSTTDAQEFAFNCCIPDFHSACENDTTLLSPVFTEFHSGRTWQLHFYPRAHDATGFTAVYAETNKDINSMNMCLEISVVNKDGRLAMTKMQGKRVDRSRMFGFAHFEYKRWIKPYVIGDILNFQTKISLSTGQQKSYSRKHTIPVITFNRQITPYHTLSLDMKTMFEKDKFYDGEFATVGGSLLVHKCILTYRCPALYDMLNGRGMGVPAFIQDMSQGSLMVLLTYVYSGALWDIYDSEISCVLRAAENFNLPHLRDSLAHGQNNHLLTAEYGNFYST